MKCIKNFLLALLMVMLLSGPAMANITVSNGDFDYDGRLYKAEIINKDGHIYLPLRTIAESMGMDVTWTGSYAIIEPVKRPAVDEKIAPMVNQALDLLQQKDPADYIAVCRHVRNIKYVETNKEKTIIEGYNTYATADFTGNYLVQIYKVFVEDKERYTPALMAGVLVHEATHWANRDMARYYKLTDAEEESLAFLREIVALKAVEAPQDLINEAENSRIEAVKTLQK